MKTYLSTLFRFGDFDRAAFAKDEEAVDWAADDSVAREVGAQSLTLLKNDGMLPLAEDPEPWR